MDLVQNHAGPVPVHMCIGHVGIESFVFLMSFIPSGSYTLSASSATGRPEPCGGGFDGNLPVRAESSKVSYSA